MGAFILPIFEAQRFPLTKKKALLPSQTHLLWLYKLVKAFGNKAASNVLRVECACQHS